MTDRDDDLPSGGATPADPGPDTGRDGPAEPIAALRAAFEAATPRPDPARKAATLAAARAAFEAGAAGASPGTARARGWRGWVGRWRLSGLAGAATALTVLALFAVLPQLRLPPDAPYLPSAAREEAPQIPPARALPDAAPAPAPLAAAPAASGAPGPIPDAPRAALRAGDMRAPIDADPSSDPAAARTRIAARLAQGRLPEPATIRAARLIDALPFGYPAPAPGSGEIAVSLALIPAPWAPADRLLRVGLRADPAGPPPRDLAIAAGDPATGDLLRPPPQAFTATLPDALPPDGQATALYAVAPEADGAGTLGTLRLTWRDGATGLPRSRVIAIPADAADAPETARAAAALAGVAAILHGQPPAPDWGLAEAAALIAAQEGPDPADLRRDVIALIRAAEAALP
jgi:hypothetical protein